LANKGEKKKKSEYQKHPSHSEKAVTEERVRSSKNRGKKSTTEGRRKISTKKERVKERQSTPLVGKRQSTTANQGQGYGRGPNMAKNSNRSELKEGRRGVSFRGVAGKPTAHKGRKNGPHPGVEKRAPQKRGKNKAEPWVGVGSVREAAPSSEHQVHSL